MTKRSGVMLQADLIALAGLWDDIHEWQTETFGDAGGLVGAANHLAQEANEVVGGAAGLQMVLDNPKVFYDPSGGRRVFGEELADVFFLLVQLTERAGVNLADAVARKLEKNKKRRWQEPDENGVVNHVEEDT